MSATRRCLVRSRQNSSSLDAMFRGQPEPRSEDCLYLNVWSPPPTSAGSARRPVMVWIHGGAFVTGSGSHPLYHGDKLATRGDVVVVTINYRLGAFGFAHLGDHDPAYEGSANNGLRDQVAALEWVQANIEHFGGDPDNVTIFGESAGAMSVTALVAAASDRGLFHRAIAQSGAGHNAKGREAAAAVTNRLLERCGVATVSELAVVDAQRLVDAEAELSQVGSVIDRVQSRRDLSETSMPFQPVVDGDFLTARPIDLVAAGAGAHIDLLAGTNADEYLLFTFMDTRPRTRDEFVARLGRVGLDESVVDRYADGSDNYKAATDRLMTELVFRGPADELLASHGGRAFDYEFTFASAAAGGALGSCHALELPFVFGHVEHPGVRAFVGGDAPAGLSASMQTAWLSFAHTGDPGWAEHPHRHVF
ncbi:MAG: carboxylesterase family protein [Acidimicrobiales bacterium]